jgi:hypothetical protein
VTLQNGRTALMDATVEGHTATVAELARLRADINAKEQVRHTAAERACAGESRPR